MARILISESIASAVMGAVVFRLAWAFTKATKFSWWVVLAFAAAVILAPGSLDEWLLREYGGAALAAHPPNPLAASLLRALTLLAGA